MQIAAIDQGTTSTRLLLARDDGGVEIVRSFRHRQFHPGPGLVEQDPQEVLNHVRTALESAGPVDAIAIANQGESCLAWDAETGVPVSPILVWQDARTEGWLERLRADGASEITLTRAGLPLDPYFSASKLGWIMREVPDARSLLAQGRLRLGTTDAFFLDRLAGCFATDETTASRTSLMNIETGRWDPQLCHLFDVPIEALPEIRPTIGRFGEIGGAPVAASVVDQQAALWGHGCRRPGDAKITFGTGAFALAVTGDRIVRAPTRGLLPTVAWSGPGGRVRAVDGGVYNAGSAVEWLIRLGLAPSAEALDRFERSPAIDRGLAFVPALSGLACPHWDRTAAATWIGLGLETDAADMVQAVLEGIAFRSAEVVAAIAEEVPIHSPVSIDGGLSRSGYFVDMLASALDRPVAVKAFADLTGFGAASLAAHALGTTLPPPDGPARIVEPDRAGAARWERFAAAVGRAKGWRRSDPG